MNDLAKTSLAHEYVCKVFPPQWVAAATDWQISPHSGAAGVCLEANRAAASHLAYDGQYIHVSGYHGAFQLERAGFGPWNELLPAGQSDLACHGVPTAGFLASLNDRLPAFLPRFEAWGAAIGARTAESGAYTVGDSVCTSLSDAVHIGLRSHVAAREITCVADVVPVATFADEHKKFQLWSDGHVSRGRLFDRDGRYAHTNLKRLAPELRDLIVHTNWKGVPPAQRLSRVQQVLDSAGQVSSSVIKSHDVSQRGFATRFSAEVQLKHVLAHGLEWWQAETNWGSMGEDGDTGRTVDICDTLEQGQAAYAEQVATYQT